MPWCSKINTAGSVSIQIFFTFIVCSRINILNILVLPVLFGTERTKEILNVNPTAVPERIEPETVSISVYDYTAGYNIEEQKTGNVSTVMFITIPAVIPGLM